MSKILNIQKNYGRTILDNNFIGGHAPRLSEIGELPINLLMWFPSIPYILGYVITDINELPLDVLVMAVNDQFGSSLKALLFALRKYIFKLYYVQI